MGQNMAKRWRYVCIRHSLLARMPRVLPDPLLADLSLVLHGGGNTSVKMTYTTKTGEAVEVLAVKGSGWDLAKIEPAGFPLVDLAHCRRLVSAVALFPS